MVGLDQQSAPKQLINVVPSHVVLFDNKFGASEYSGLFWWVNKKLVRNYICLILVHVTLIRKSPRWCVLTQPRGSFALTNQVNVSSNICRCKLTWLILSNCLDMVTHYLDVKLHIVHYFKSMFNVYFHINLACKIKVNSTCSVKPS